MKTVMNTFLSIVLLSSVLLSCQQNKFSPEVASYLNAALDSIEMNALNSSNLDWEQLRQEVFKKAEGAIETTQAAIEWITEQADCNN